MLRSCNWSVFLGAILVLAMSQATAGSKIQHSYILSLDANTPQDTMDKVVESLKQNGAKIDNVISYPDIMQAISFSDTRAAEQGQLDMQSDEVRIETWKANLESVSDGKIVALEQDQVVGLPTPVEAEA